VLLKRRKNFALIVKRERRKSRTRESGKAESARKDGDIEISQPANHFHHTLFSTYPTIPENSFSPREQARLPNSGMLLNNAAFFFSCDEIKGLVRQIKSSYICILSQPIRKEGEVSRMNSAFHRNRKYMLSIISGTGANFLVSN